MAFSVASTASNSVSTGTSVTINKPSGLAVGDLMIAVVSAQGGSVTVDTLSGWTSADFENGSNNYTKIQYKIADSSDVSASNFTFTSAFSVNLMGGTIMRVTGHATSSIVDVSDSQNYNSTATTGISFSQSLTIAFDGSLIVMGFCGSVQGVSGAGSIGTYVASDGTLSWTETHDYGEDDGTADPIIGGAYAIQATKANLSSYGATLSLSRQVHTGVIVVFKPTINASGTAALHSADADFFTPTASAGTTGTNALLQADADTFAPTAKGTSPTQWTPGSKPTTTWTPQSK